MLAAQLEAPEASAKSREEKRFSRADKDKDGKIEPEELLGSRRKAFAKLDTSGNGTLSFEEWAANNDRKVQGRRQGPERLADPRRICDDRAAATEAQERFVLNSSPSKMGRGTIRRDGGGVNAASP